MGVPQPKRKRTAVKKPNLPAMDTYVKKWLLLNIKPVFHLKSAQENTLSQITSRSPISWLNPGLPPQKMFSIRYTGLVQQTVQIVVRFALTI